jgi:hypothetical protein
MGDSIVSPVSLDPELEERLLTLSTGELSDDGASEDDLPVVIVAPAASDEASRMSLNKDREENDRFTTIDSHPPPRLRSKSSAKSFACFTFLRTAEFVTYPSSVTLFRDHGAYVSSRERRFR